MKSKENGGVKLDFWSATVLFEYTQWTDTVYTLIVLSALHRVV